MPLALTYFPPQLQLFSFSFSFSFPYRPSPGHCSSFFIKHQQKKSVSSCGLLLFMCVRHRVAFGGWPRGCWSFHDLFRCLLGADGLYWTPHSCFCVLPSFLRLCDSHLYHNLCVAFDSCWSWSHFFNKNACVVQRTGFCVHLFDVLRWPIDYNSHSPHSIPFMLV